MSKGNNTVAYFRPQIQYVPIDCKTCIPVWFSELGYKPLYFRDG